MSVHSFPASRQVIRPNGLGLAEAGRHLRAAALIFWAGVREAARRQRTRRHLVALEPHLLRDIGVTRTDAQAEAAKPFWIA